MHRIFVKVTLGSMPAEKRGRKQEWAEGEGNSDADPILDNSLSSPRLATAIQIVPSSSKMTRALHFCIHQPLNMGYPRKGHDPRQDTSLQMNNLWRGWLLKDVCWYSSWISKSFLKRGSRRCNYVSFIVYPLCCLDSAHICSTYREFGGHLILEED